MVCTSWSVPKLGKRNHNCCRCRLQAHIESLDQKLVLQDEKLDHMTRLLSQLLSRHVAQDDIGERYGHASNNAVFEVTRAGSPDSVTTSQSGLGVDEGNDYPENVRFVLI